jgi:methylphosphotriester-DNA--protein-cysteine methyltransferase
MTEQYCDAVEKAKEIIEKEYSNIALNLELIATEACVEKCHLCKEFKKRFGITVQKYLFDRRLSCLRTLVTQYPQKSISILLLEAGFVSYRSLAHYLKKHHHIQPSDLYKGTS